MSLIQDPSTGTAANVTNANTAPVAGDQALVVTISPNSTAIATTNLSVAATGSAPPVDATYIGALVTTAIESGLASGDMYPLSLTTTGLLRVDGSNVTQPISGTVIANAGAGTFTVAGTVTANQGGSPWSQNITQFGGTNISTGTGASGVGIPRVTISNDSNILATQSGVWTIQPGNTPNSAPWLVTDSSDGSVVPGVAASKSSLIGGQFNTSLPTLSNTQQSSIQLDSSGRVIISSIPTGANTIGAVTQSGSWTTTVTQATASNLNATVVGTTPAGSGASTGLVTIQGNASGTPIPVSGTMAVTQSTSPWVVSASGSFNNASVGATASTPPADATYVGGLVTTAVESGLTNNDMYPLSLTTAGLLRIDGSNVTQPVSGTIIANAGTGTFTVGQATAANLNATVVGSGNFTVVQATASNLNATVTANGNFNNASISATAAAPPANATYVGGLVTTAIESGLSTGDMYPLSMTTTGFLRVDGSNVTQPVSGTVTANAGTGTFTVAQATASNLNATVVGLGNFNNASVSATGAAGPADATYVGGAVTTAAPTYTTGQMNPLSLTIAGGLRVASISESAIAGTVPASATFVGGEVQAVQSGLTTGDIYPLSMTTAGLLRVDGSNVTQPISGTITANQGTANSLANAWSTKITDDTNGPVAVKAASTAAVAADPALVVAISPNNHFKATVEPLYGTSGQAITVTLASLASGAARASTVVSNTTNLYEDVHLFVKITTAASGVSTTGYVNVYGYGTVDGGTNYPEAITGTDAGVTLTSPPNLVLLAQINANTDGATKTFGPFSFCRMYGLDRLPASWGVVVVNQTGAAFNATAGNFLVEYQGINGQLA